jgi:hypothetical protein
MAFKPEEIKKFQDMADEMARLIEDRDTTSNEASIAYSKIGRVCSRAIAEDAALAAKRTARANNVTKFQAARQNRNSKRPGAAPQPAQAARGGAQQQQKTS